MHTKTCTQMLIEGLFAKAPRKKQPTCSSTGEWINKIIMYSYKGILLNNKKSRMANNTSESHSNYTEWEKLDEKEDILFDSTCTKL